MYFDETFKLWDKLLGRVTFVVTIHYYSIHYCRGEDCFILRVISKHIHKFRLGIQELAPVCSRHAAVIGGIRVFPAINNRNSSGVYVTCIYCDLSVK